MCCTIIKLSNNHAFGHTCISGRNKFSVIFGLGIPKFWTGVVKDPEGNPMWNEETVV